MTSVRLLLIFAFAFIVSSYANATSSLKTGNAQDRVYLIFDKPMDQSVFITETNGRCYSLGSSFLSYIDSDGFPVYLDRPEDGEVISLPVHNGYIEVGHQYKGSQITYFYLKGGDTVTFSYNKLKQPFATSKLSPQLTRQYNFASRIKGASSLHGFCPKVCLRLLLMPVNDRLAYYKSDYKNYIDNYKQALDSARTEGLLDSVYSKYYQYRYKAESDRYRFFGEHFNGSQDFTKKFPMDDSLVDYISYLEIVNYSSFEAIETDTSLPPRSRNLAMYNVLRLWNIPSQIQRGIQQLEPYYKRVVEITGDSVMVNRLKAEFPEYYASLKNIKTDDLMLKDLSGNSIMLKNVLDKHKGKVVYIDFWASWCSPCVGLMPAGLELRKAYAGKQVAFLYLSQDGKEAAWKDAVKQHKIDQQEGENYFVVNNNAEFIKKLNISTIPRYIIVDKSGGIVNSHAPRPGSKEINIEIEKYLK